MSDISRRKFIGSAAIAGGAAIFLSRAALGQSRDGLFAIPAEAADALSGLGWDAFLPFVNTDFDFYTVGRGGASIPMRLVDMSDSRPLRSRSRRTRQENFVLKFRAEEKLPLGDGIYSVNHFNLGDFDLFITQAGRERGGGYFYIAVINRVTVAEKFNGGSILR